MITAAQCRSARTLLNWSINKLASAASVSENTIDDFELERGQPDSPTLVALRHAFEAVGVEFLAGDDVRLARRPIGHREAEPDTAAAGDPSGGNRQCGELARPVAAQRQ